MTTYDQKINKLFYYWLLLSFSMIVLMVVVGGLTRLTNSGLSITEWELFSGILPPLNSTMWNKYFLLYKEIPQYKLVNNQMSLNDFKVIFYWEYFHRVLGRLIGLFFLIPLVFFTINKVIDKKNLKICYIVLTLIIFQGFAGWYMVKSGLINNITVSHYRLSLHLGIAIIILCIMFWLILNLRNKTSIFFFINKKNKIYFLFLIFIIFLQIIFGAFVSGLDAGKIYQTWPLMNDNYFPSDTNILSYKDIVNFDNQSLVQFYHRNLAYIIFVLFFILGIYIYCLNIRKLFKPFFVVFLFLSFQIFLGIITLITDLNIYLALGHQICGLLLILSVINLYHGYIK